jgi:hypothetical protein
MGKVPIDKGIEYSRPFMAFPALLIWQDIRISSELIEISDYANIVCTVAAMIGEC